MGKGAGYERWAKIFNLNYLTENNLLVYEDLEKKSYGKYNSAKKEKQNILTAKANVDRLLGKNISEKEKEKLKEQR